MTAWLTAKNAAICNFLWGPYMLTLFFFVGLMFSIGTGFFQIRHIKLWLSYTFCALFKKEKTEKGSISQFQALSTALAATVGTGNITGVAAALSIGGPGAIFWMWVSAFFGMMTAYAESVLTILYRYKDKSGNYIGGAMVYMEKGLGLRFFAVLFSVFCVLASFGMGNMAQMHSVSSALSGTFGIPTILTGVLGSLLLALVISGGLKRIASVTEKLVPLMVILFFMGSIVCLYQKAGEIVPSLRLIVRSAFTVKSAAGGALGYGLRTAMRVGISRGVFSNEAGLGSSTCVHASSSVQEPCIQGMWGIFEVFVDTIVVCTLTALVILTSGVYVPSPEGNAVLEGVQLTSAAFGVGLGSLGTYFISVSVVFFAFATVLGWSYFGQRSISYLFGNRSVGIYKCIYVLIACIGAVSSMELVWGISDTFNALMAVPNLICLLFLSGNVFRETRRFMRSPYGFPAKRNRLKTPKNHHFK